MGDWHNLARRVMLTAVAWLSSSSLAQAQCVMCRLSAENAADPATVARTLTLAILVLLIPTAGLLGGVAYLVYRWR